MQRISTTLLLLFMAVFSALPCQGQNARKLLDAASAKLLKSGGMQAQFTATNFQGLKESGSVSGTIKVQGNKFHVQTPGMTTWFDGKTQWSMMAGSDEVNISTPTAADVQKMNPYHFITLYKKGYSATSRKVSYGGKSCNEVTLNATRAADFSRIVIILDASGVPLNVRLRDGKGNWLRFRIGSLQTGKRFPASTFIFDKSKHPGVEIIDLR